MKKKTLSLAVLGALLAFGVATQARASSAIMFDADGAGPNPAFTVDTFDWLPSSALAANSVPVTLNNAFTLFSHASLSQFVLGGNPIAGTGLNTAYELTYVAGFGEKTISATTSPLNQASFVFDPTNQTNFFRMYIDTKRDADSSLTAGPAGAGTGFNNGTLILSGHITSSDATFAVFNNNGGRLDQFNGDQFSGVVGATTNSVRGVGGGATTLNSLVAIDFIHPEFFPAAPGFTVDFNTSFITPFSQVDPSTQFWNGTAYITPNLGATNGVTGPDFELQVDANQSFSPVPVPPSVLLLGSGLMGLVGFARRRNRE